ncbi:MAG: type II secretion system protein [Akkermansiaceae bacterium]
MKLTKTAKTQIKPGMTLIEITVVILVLLTLIGVLFIGANIYKQGADRAACILNIRNIHQAVRANQNLNGKNATTDPIVRADIIGAGKYIEEEPTCPKNSQIGTTPAGASAALTSDYSLVANYPAVGTAATGCDQFAAEADGGHVPASVKGW